MESQEQQKSKKYTGFESYLKNHEFTPEFISDYQYWCKRIFKNWTLFTEFENFYGICWAALLDKDKGISHFDPNIATIQTFCISRINNEAWRLYMKNKTIRPEVDCDDPIIQGSLSDKGNEKELFDVFHDFELYANSLGVSVNIKELYEDYTENKYSAPMIAFTSWRAMNNEVGG